MSATLPSSADSTDFTLEAAASGEEQQYPELQQQQQHLNESSRGSTPTANGSSPTTMVSRKMSSSSSLPRSISSTPNTLGNTPETAAITAAAARRVGGGSANDLHQLTAFPSAPKTTTDSVTVVTTTHQQQRPTFSSSSTRHPHRTTSTPKAKMATASPRMSPVKKLFAFNVNALPFVPIPLSDDILNSPAMDYHNTSVGSSSTPASSSPKTKLQSGNTPHLHPMKSGSIGFGEDYAANDEDYYDSYDTDTDYNYCASECSVTAMATGGGGGTAAQPRGTALRDSDLDAMDANLGSNDDWDEYIGDDSDEDSYQDDLDEGEREWLESMLLPKENPPGIFK